MGLSMGLTTVVFQCQHRRTIPHACFRMVIKGNISRIPCLSYQPINDYNVITTDYISTMLMLSPTCYISILICFLWMWKCVCVFYFNVMITNLGLCVLGGLSDSNKAWYPEQTNIYCIFRVAIPVIDGQLDNLTAWLGRKTQSEACLARLPLWWNHMYGADSLKT